MSTPITSVLNALNSASVRYLIVGGVAVVLHGHLRTTADLDVVIQLSNSNLSSALQVLKNLDFSPRAPVNLDAFADENTRREWVEDKGLTVFSLWSPKFPAFELDVFVVEPFDFDEVYSRALSVDLGDAQATVVSLEDLIQLKKFSGRTQDLADIEALNALHSDDAEQ